MTEANNIQSQVSPVYIVHLPNYLSLPSHTEIKTVPNYWCLFSKVILSPREKYYSKKTHAHIYIIITYIQHFTYPSTNYKRQSR